jgi:lipopolysaccharide biosynthesis glycosyltransferase
MIPVFVGYDPRESVAYHAFCQSILARSSEPVSFSPLALNTLKLDYKEKHGDGSNQFIYSRFLVPHLQNYQGWAIFADGDMVCLDDIAKLWAMRDDKYAVMVVKHDYKTRHPVKYLGAKNEDYPRKNWSSLILWNCKHHKNRILRPYMVQTASGAFLHRFSWLDDEDIGEISKEWNWLADEYEHQDGVSLVHYTIGGPYFTEFMNCDYADEWRNAYADVIHCEQRECKSHS